MSGKLKTLGVSPKVANPTLVLIVVGAALLIAGHFLHDPILRAIGVSILGAAGVIVAPIGYQSSPGTIVGDIDAVIAAAKSDPEVAAAIEAAKQRVGEANTLLSGLSSGVKTVSPPVAPQTISGGNADATA